MLQRSTQVGEFYRMSPPAVWDLNNALPPSYMGEPLKHSNPILYAFYVVGATLVNGPFNSC
jgi:hypothetical protein